MVSRVSSDCGIRGDAKYLVNDRFVQSMGLVRNFDSESSSALASLANADFSVPLENLNLFPTDPHPPAIGDAPVPDKVDAYESQAQEVAFPDLTALQALLGLVDVTVEQVDLPNLSAIEPTITLPDAPDDTIPEVPSDAPEVADPTVPSEPMLNMPAVPVLEDIALPAEPTIDYPVFEGMMPEMDLTPPEPMFVYEEESYQSDLADAIKLSLYNTVVNGGTGLDPEVEQAIWDRGLSRLNIELDKLHRQVLNDWGAWNQEMPDGILSGALREVDFEEVRTRLDANRDVSIEQARLAQTNSHFAITNGLVYEKQVMDYTNQVNQRAFEVARYQVAALIDIFNLKVNSYNAQLEAYKTLSQVYEARIRAELAKVEVYKAQIEGAKVKGELQVQKVEIYSKQVQALQIIIDLYRAQMEGARLQVDVDKAKLESFRARVDAAVAQIQGVTSKYNLYQAQLAGETTKVDLYSKQVDAYASQVNAAKTKADVNLAEVQAAIEQNKDKIATLGAAIDKYKADTQYELGKDETGSRVYAAQVGGYEAEVGREGEYLKALVESYKGQVSEAMARAEMIVKEMDANLRAATAAKELQVEALKAATAATSQKVASALSSTSASAQVGFNESLADTCSRSTQESTAVTTSYSDVSNITQQYITSSANDYRENHNYYYNE
jgi:hypothetical protein